MGYSLPLLILLMKNSEGGLILHVLNLLSLQENELKGAFLELVMEGFGSLG